MRFEGKQVTAAMQRIVATTAAECRRPLPALQEVHWSERRYVCKLVRTLLEVLDRERML
jgi:hypothetical protein